MTTCWGITDGSTGTVSQIRALAQALGVECQMKKVALRALLAWQPNAMYAAGHRQLILSGALNKKRSDPLDTPWPPLVISCGRKGALIAMGMRHVILSEREGSPSAQGDSSPPAQNDRTKFIHIQDPRAPAECYDLVIAMQHDDITGPNVIKTRFSLHTITPGALAAAREQYAPRFAAYPEPRVAVLIGGSTNKYTLRKEGMAQIIAGLDTVLRNSSASLLITASRRTGEVNAELLTSYFSSNDRVYVYDGQGDNPYMGLLALADHIIITNDSVNMMSEAHATGKPLYILPLPGHHHTRPARFANALIGDGIARPLGALLESWAYPASDDMAALATEVRTRLALP